MEAVDIKNLTKFYNKKSRGIIDISFSIKEGEIFGFIGPNGAGKSTTIRTLLNFIYPTSGSAAIFGKDIIKDSKEIRQNTGYLPSEVHYYDDMKVCDLLNYSANFHKKLNVNRMKELSDKLDLDLNKKIEDLSFGNRKKVGIVQALLHDPLMQNAFFELLEDERKKGVTIFFSSHILSEVQRMCDRVAIIKDGKLIKVETVENLTKSKIKNVSVILEKPQEFNLDIKGIKKKEINNNTVSFLYNGDMKELLNKINTLEFKDILIEEPSLEEIFMHYYEKQEG
jgi:ABC-2 type transport system ATP-binding protein